jgi:hypothetical protein
MLQGTDRVEIFRLLNAHRGGTSHDGHSPALLASMRADEAAALPITGGCVVRPARSVLRPPPTPCWPAVPFPDSVIGRHAPTLARNRRASKGLPSSRRHLPNVPRPLRREVPGGCTSRVFTTSMAFTLRDGTRLPLPCPAYAGTFTARLRLMHGPLGRSPFTGPLTLRFDAGRSPRRRQPATGPPVGYPDRTPIGWQRRASDQVMTVTRSPPDPLGRLPGMVEVEVAVPACCLPCGRCRATAKSTRRKGTAAKRSYCAPRRARGRRPAARSAREAPGRDERGGRRGPGEGLLAMSVAVGLRVRGPVRGSTDVSSGAQVATA